VIDISRNTQDDQSAVTPISERVAVVLLAELSALRLPIITDFAMGFDGTTYRQMFRRGFNAHEFTWRGRVPPQWAPLAPLIRRLLALGGEQAAGVRVE
jgi:hypothetical protein